MCRSILEMTREASCRLPCFMTSEVKRCRSGSSAGGTWMTGGSAASRGRMEADVEAGEGVWRVTLEMTPFCACAAPGREEDALSVASLRAFIATAGRKANRVAALRKLANIVPASKT